MPFKSALKKMAVLCIVKLQRTFLYKKLMDSILPATSIKEAEEEERKLIQSLMKIDLPEAETNPDFRITDFVAKKGKKSVGGLQLIRRPEKYKAEAGHWLYGMVVKSFYRNMGIGEKLTQHVIEQATQEGEKELLLLVREVNHPAVKLYKKLGFKLKVIPALEELLQKEKSVGGGRRIVMSRRL